MRNLRIHRMYFTNSDCYKANVRQTSITGNVHIATPSSITDAAPTASVLRQSYPATAG